MDLNDLNLFVRIARLDSISAAARDLNITPATASARLSAFERRLGVRLLHRTTRRATLTEDGRAFLPHAEECTERGSVSLCAALGPRADITTWDTSDRSSRLIRTNAHRARPAGLYGSGILTLKLDMRISDSVVDLVEGAFDVAVRYTELSDSSFVARRLALDRRVLVAAPDYLERCGHPNLSE